MQNIEVSPYKSALMQNALAVFIDIFSQSTVTVLLSWTDRVELLLLGGYEMCIVLYIIHQYIGTKIEENPSFYGNNEIMRVLYNLFTRLFLFIFFITLRFFVQIIKIQLITFPLLWYNIMTYIAIIICIILLSVYGGITTTVLSSDSTNTVVESPSTKYRNTLTQNTMAVFIDIFSQATVEILLSWTDRKELLFLGGFLLCIFILIFYYYIDSRLKEPRHIMNELFKVLQSFNIRLLLFFFFITLRFFISIITGQLIFISLEWFDVMTKVIIIITIMILLLQQQVANSNYQSIIIQSTVAVFIDIFSQGTVLILLSITSLTELLLIGSINISILLMLIHKSISSQLEKNVYKNNEYMKMLDDVFSRSFLFSFFITLRFFVLILQNQIITFSLRWDEIMVYGIITLGILTLAMH